MNRAASVLATAGGLALAAAVSLGLARFSYALLLPPMRADLGWSYLTAGVMNTANAAGYLAGALLAPGWLARHDARRVMLAGAAATALLLMAHGAALGDAALYLLRLLTGVGSAATFVAGGLLAARLSQAGAAAATPVPAGLVLGLYYGGTGLGIVASALLVPPLAGRWARWRWPPRPSRSRRCARSMRRRRRGPPTAASAGARSASAWPPTSCSASATSAT